MDLSALSNSEVKVVLFSLDDCEMDSSSRAGRCIDHHNPESYVEAPDQQVLSVSSDVVDDEQLYSDLFRSNCPVTGQPDWASFEIRYTGPKIDESALLSYLCSFRQHQAYHEECAERIFRGLQTSRTQDSDEFPEKRGLGHQCL